MKQQKKILELHRSGFATQEEADSQVQYWATRGITIVWGVPVLANSAQTMKMPEGTPTKECPGCQKSVYRHWAHWRQAIKADGMPGKFVKYCRRCEDNKAGFACRECRKHKAGSLYKQNESGRRLRICDACRLRPLAKRKVKCSKCKKRRPGTEFRWKDRDQLTTVGACQPCERKYWKTNRKPRTRKKCDECQLTKSHSEFDLGPGGSRLQWTCRACISDRLTDQPRACSSCKEVKAANLFSETGYRAGERKTTCKACLSRVQAYKNRRKRAKAKEVISKQKGV